jgi:hypothetical protein
MQCLKCKKPLEPMAKKGRKQRYCSVACRRLTEFETRRLVQTLDNLAARKLYLEQPHIQMSAIPTFPYGSVQAELEDVVYSISIVESRLRALLETSESETKNCE